MERSYGFGVCGVLGLDVYQQRGRSQFLTEAPVTTNVTGEVADGIVTVDLFDKPSVKRSTRFVVLARTYRVRRLASSASI
jgi:hypothetical protein